MSGPAKAAWVWCGASVAVATARIVLAVVDPASSDSSSDPAVPGGGVPVAVFEATILSAIAVIGALVASREPRNPIGWILSAIAFCLGVLVFTTHLFWALHLGETRASDGALFVAWLGWIWIPAMIPALTLFPLYFPTGRPPTPRWRWVQWVALASLVTVLIGGAFAPGRLEEYPVDNPLGAPGAVGTAVSGLSLAGFVAMLVAMVGAAASLVVRFHRSRDDERLQIKWVATAAVVFVVIFVFPTDLLVGDDDVGFVSLLVGLLIIMIAVAISILKYRLYDIDVVINRALVYGSLTATLAGVYVGSVLLLQLALSDLTEGSGLAVAASTLAVAALFRPARARIQRSVDRRFFRSRYDARRTVEAFGAHLRDEVDLAELSNSLQAVVHDTMRPAHVSLWLREQR